MKKLLVILMVLAFAAPAMAADSLTATGSMRVEVYNFTNKDFSDADDQDQQYWDQRFRLQMRFRPADGVQATVRADITEDPWGQMAQGSRPGLNPSGAATAAGSANQIIMVDRAFLSVDKGLINITAGLNTWNLGQGIAYNNQTQGISLTLKTPLAVTVGYTVEDENGSLADTDKTVPDSNDTNTYLVNLGYKYDTGAFNVYYAAQTDNRKDANKGDAEPNGFGVHWMGKAGPIGLNLELNIFGGENKTGPTKIDLFGTQFFGDVEWVLNDQWTLGAHVIYAAGSDKANEQQITAVADFADYVVQDFILPHHGPGSIQPFLGGPDVFDVGFGTGQGSIGLGPYAKFKLSDEWLFAAHIIYNQKASDNADPTIEIDNRTMYGIGASWAMLPRTKLDFGYTGATISKGDNFVGDVESYQALGAILSVSF